MKILHIITSLKIGGAESALLNLLTKFKEQNEDQHYVAYFYDGPNVQKIKNLGIPVFKISGLFFKYDLLAYFRLKKLIQKIKPDILHCALWTANIFGRIIGSNLKIPVICDLHSNFSHDGKLRQKLEQLFIKKEATFVAVSNTSKDGFLKSVIEKVQNKEIREKLKKNTLIINNGIDIENVIKKASQNKITRQEIGLHETDFVIGSVGRLDPIKSQDILIKSFALFCRNLNDSILKHGNSKLCLIGDGPSRKSLETLAKNLNLENKVIFLGQKNYAYNFYPVFDCFALSSKSEGLSIALLEALCFGLPIITTHNKEKHDVIIHQENGFLIPVGDIKKMAEAFATLYNSSELINKIKIQNATLVKTQFEIKKTAEKYKELYGTIYKNFILKNG
jgi:glycosyltransferase involved in cell wall biosynthesis